MKTILIPTDLFPFSQKAVEELVPLLRGFGSHCRLLLLHTFLPASAAEEDIIEINDRLKQESLAGLAQQAKILKQHLDLDGKRVIESLSRLGTWENVIPRVVETEHVNFIIINLDKEIQKKILTVILDRVSCPTLLLPSSSGTQR